MLPQTPRLWFTDFDHANSRKEIRAHNPIYHLLRTRYEVVLDKQTPQFLFYSVKGFEYWRYPCPRIFYTCESDPPDFAHCDWALSNAHTSSYAAPEGRALYFPSWVLYLSSVFGARLLRQRQAESAEQIFAAKQKFCAFLAFNGGMRKRNRLVALLAQRRLISCPGRVLRNSRQNVPQGDFYDMFKTVSWQESRRALRAFYRQHKFAVVFENDSLPGYVTEKLPMALLARTIPIYQGPPDVTDIFHPDVFIRAQDFCSLEKLAAYVSHVHGDDELYLRYLRAPIFRDHAVRTADARIEQFFKFCARIFAQGKPQARFWSWKKFVQSRHYRSWPERKKWRFQWNYRTQRRNDYARAHSTNR